MLRELNNNALYKKKRTHNVSKATESCQKIKRASVAAKKKKKMKIQRALRQIINNNLGLPNSNMGVRTKRTRKPINKFTFSVQSNPKARKKQKGCIKKPISIASAAKTPAQKAAQTRALHKTLKNNPNISDISRMFNRIKM